MSGAAKESVPAAKLSGEVRLVQVDVGYPLMSVVHTSAVKLLPPVSADTTSTLLRTYPVECEPMVNPWARGFSVPLLVGLI